MVVELVSLWDALLTKIKMEPCAIQSAKPVTQESAQFVGKIASVTPQMPELLAPKSLMAELLESR